MSAGVSTTIPLEQVPGVMRYHTCFDNGITGHQITHQTQLCLFYNPSLFQDGLK